MELCCFLIGYRIFLKSTKQAFTKHPLTVASSAKAGGMNQKELLPPKLRDWKEKQIKEKKLKLHEMCSNKNKNKVLGNMTEGGLG